MALADTAKLIVEMSLRDQITGGLRNVNRQLGSMDRTLQTVSTRVSRTGQAISTALGVGLERLAEGGIRALVGSVQSGVEEMQRLEDANLQTAAAIRSTDGVAGQTVAGIRQMAEDFETLNATVDDKAIQEAANVLLTFRKVGEQAFEPALEAALDLSTRMQGDVQGAILQVGKALEDPIRGVTALRRAGVQLSEQQEDQIKTLVEQNRLYEAQQIILRELNVQVGGSFAAQGRGDAARAAALRDRIEDLQRVFATGLAPGLTRVREGLIEAFDNPRVIAGVRTVGESIANFLSAENLRAAGGVAREVFGFLSSVPWSAIGDGLRLAGSGVKVVVDAFNSLPREVQGVLVAGLAVNKLSGGIVGSLAGVALSQLKTITAGHVTVVGPVTGAPGVGGGGLLGGLGRGLATGAAVAGGAALAGVAAVEVVNFEAMRNEQRSGLQGILDEMPRTRDRIDASIAAIQSEINMERPFLEGILFNTNVKPQLEAELAELREIKASQKASEGAAQAREAHAASRAAGHLAELQRSRTATVERLTTLAGKYDVANAQLSNANRVLTSINAKNPIHPVTVNNSITIPVSISATLLEQRLVTARLASVGIPTAPTIL